MSSLVVDVLTNTPIREYVDESTVVAFEFDVIKYFGCYILDAKGCLFNVQDGKDYFGGNKVAIGALVYAVAFTNPTRYVVIFTSPDGLLYRSLFQPGEEFMVVEIYENPVYGASYSPVTQLLTFANADREVVSARCNSSLTSFNFTYERISVSEDVMSIQSVPFGDIVFLAVLDKERLSFYIRGTVATSVEGVSMMTCVKERFFYIKNDGAIYSWSCKGNLLFDTVRDKREIFGTTLLYEKGSVDCTDSGKGRYFTLSEYIKFQDYEKASYVELM